MNSTEYVTSHDHANALASLAVNLTTPAFLNFIAGCSKITDEHSAANYPVAHTTSKTLFQSTAGDKFIRVARAEYARPIEIDSKPYARSAHCFIDRTNGDVLKAASWAKPAKGARGNIFDAHNGLGRMNAYGPAYNR